MQAPSNLETGPNATTSPEAAVSSIPISSKASTRDSGKTLEDRLEYLEAAVGALAGYVPVQDLKENEGWKSLEDHVLGVSTKVSQVTLEDAKAYIEMQTAAAARKSEAVFASTWEKALK